ncbi:TPA: hypothetical protein NJ322_005029 [Vibrio parahaemolyticus]|nr:hypothetical protein [Vibrio parahaemolyticus]HCG7105673.1 hypothetical protein [Vibrio parahaemolyticus]
MKVQISTVEFSAIEIEEVADDCNLGNTERRYSRTATLDGEVVHEDYGCTNKDRMISFTFNNPSHNLKLNLEALVKSNQKVHVACHKELFECYPIRVTTNPSKVTFFLAVDDVF